MKKSKSEIIRLMTGIGILAAVTVALQLISNYLPVGVVNINLAILPIIVGACLYGPWAGLALGVIDGAIVLTAPSTSSFLVFSVPLTILVCLLKTGVAGLVGGFVFKWINKKNDWVATVVASILVPTINTLIFILLVFAFFMPLYETWGGVTGAEAYKFVVVSTLTINFVIELVYAIALSSGVHTVIKIVSKKIAMHKSTRLVDEDETSTDSNE